MASTLVQDRVDAASMPAAVSYHQMPLSFMKGGETGRISSVRGRGEIHHHLENLGFVEGAPVKVVCENAGNFIVEIKGAQVALDRSVAQKVLVA